MVGMVWTAVRVDENQIRGFNLVQSICPWVGRGDSAEILEHLTLSVSALDSSFSNALRAWISNSRAAE